MLCYHQVIPDYTVVYEVRDGDNKASMATLSCLKSYYVAWFREIDRMDPINKENLIGWKILIYGVILLY